MVNKNQVGHVRAERDVLAASSIPWIVELLYSFQVIFLIKIIPLINSIYYFKG